MNAIHYLPRWIALAAVFAAGGGCQSPWISGDDRHREPPAATIAHSRDALPKPPQPNAGANGNTAPQVDDALLLGVMDKLQQISQLDPTAAPRLLAELQDTPPEFWPAAAEQFRSSLAYHQQLVARNKPAEQAEGVAQTVQDRETSGNQSPRLVNSPAHATLPVEQANFSIAATANDQGQHQNKSALVPNAQSPIPGPPSSAQDWHELVGLAAGDLDARVAESPASTAEVHQHVTLRLLRLLAGQTEQALEPIPNLPPHEQDYWSHQIFALATYLDHHAQPENKRRAAASAIHLDEALTNLREVGALSLRNLTICKKVSGYGVFDPYENARFSPGQSLILYVEVENYHSQSTDKGYSALLASSYELLDADGKRVAGDAFPDVSDLCRSRRRDFHIQYSLTLPPKLTAGRYRLQLVVHDRLSDEIGNATVELEIGGAKSLESRVESQKELK